MTETDKVGARPPVVFISYARESSEHSRWVRDFAAQLCAQGVDVDLDQWNLKPGMDLPFYMEQAIQNADRVLLILTESYVRKADSRDGGVGFECVLMTSEILEDLKTAKFIPLVRQNGQPQLPRGFGKRYYIDFSDDNDFEVRFLELLRALHADPADDKPPIGQNPFARQRSSLQGRPEPATLASLASREQLARWRELLSNARTNRQWIELENELFFEVGAGQRALRQPALLAGPILVGDVLDDSFSLGIPLRARTGITRHITPFSFVESVWLGSEQRLHVALRNDILFKDGTSLFIDRAFSEASSSGRRQSAIPELSMTWRTAKRHMNGGYCHRHDYELDVTLRNSTSRNLREWHVEVEIPAILQEPGAHPGAVRTHRRTSDDTRRVLYPGDQEVLTVPYVVDDVIYANRETVFPLHIRARAYADGQLIRECDEVVESMQDF